MVNDLHKVSFIVIAKNQGRTIVECINSILSAANTLELKHYEIIYVDSNSSDNTIELLKNHFLGLITIYQLNSTTSAAIGRNVGAYASSGDVLFFIDGDMEIYAPFIQKVFSETEGLKYDVVSGRLREYNYNRDWELISKVEDHYGIDNETYKTNIGGVFLIKSKIFFELEGFRMEYRIFEDYDFGIRLDDHKYKFIRIPETIALHKTIQYYNIARLFHRVRRGDPLYSGYLFRQHFYKKKFLLDFLRREKFLLLLIITILLSIKIHPVFLLLYPVAVFAKFVNNPVNKYFEVLLGKLIDNVMFIPGLFLLKEPMKLSDIKYEKIMDEKAVIVGAGPGC